MKYNITSNEIGYCDERTKNVCNSFFQQYTAFIFFKNYFYVKKKKIAHLYEIISFRVPSDI